MWTSIDSSVAAWMIFAATYFVISFQGIPRIHLDRPAAAMLGGTLMVVCGVLTLEEAWEAIEPHTIILLLGMMILNVFLDLSGFFEMMVKKVLHAAEHPFRLLLGLAVLSGGLSALFLNDTTCLMLTPPLVMLLKKSKLPPAPFLLTLAMSSNVGSVVSLTGNPQNMLIGQFGQISYVEFLLWMLLPGIAGMGALLLILRWRYHRELQIEIEVPPSAGETPEALIDRALLKKTLVVLSLVLIGFVATSQLALVSMAGAGLLILWTGIPASKVLARVDWILLLFFSGLFIVIHGLEKAGGVEQFAALTKGMQDWPLVTRIGVFSLVTIAACNLVSNVPYVLLVQSIVPTLGEPKLMWLVLALVSTFGGNLTIPGSVATLIVLEGAKDDVQIGFFEFLRVGLWMVGVTVVVGILILLGEYWVWEQVMGGR